MPKAIALENIIDFHRIGEHNQVLGQLLRTLNPDELKKVYGDVFGRTYEYFLTQFADQKAHDGGEFFTPISLVSLIAHVLDPDRGTVLDPACGSGGMFVQSARIVEEHGQSPLVTSAFPRRGCACAFSSVGGKFSVCGGKILAFSRVGQTESGFSVGVLR